MTAKIRHAGSTDLFSELVVAGRARRGSQAWDYDSTWKIGETVVRVRIHRDTYDFQSTLEVDAYDPDRRQWNSFIRWGLLPEHASFGVTHGALSEDPLPAFHKDETALLGEATAILTAAWRRS